MPEGFNEKKNRFKILGQDSLSQGKEKIPYQNVLCFVFSVWFLMKEREIAQPAHNVRTTLYGRCYEAKTLKWRQNSVDLTLCVAGNESGLWCTCLRVWWNSIRDFQQQLIKLLFYLIIHGFWFHFVFFFIFLKQPLWVKTKGFLFIADIGYNLRQLLYCLRMSLWRKGMLGVRATTSSSHKSKTKKKLLTSCRRSWISWFPLSISFNFFCFSTHRCIKDLRIDNKMNNPQSF